jgi:hypothetical protein
MARATRMFAWMIPGEARVFRVAELERAKAWVAGEAVPGPLSHGHDPPRRARRRLRPRRPGVRRARAAPAGALADVTIHPTRIAAGDTLEAGRCVARLALAPGGAGRVVVHDVAVTDEAQPRVCAGRTGNGALVVGRDGAQCWSVRGRRSGDPLHARAGPPRVAPRPGGRPGEGHRSRPRSPPARGARTRALHGSDRP